MRRCFFKYRNIWNKTTLCCMLCMLSNCTKSMIFQKKTLVISEQTKKNTQTTNPNPPPPDYSITKPPNHQTPNPPTNSSLGYSSILPFFQGSPWISSVEPLPLVEQQGRLTSWDAPRPPAQWKATTRWPPWPGWKGEVERSHGSVVDFYGYMISAFFNKNLNGGKYVSRSNFT